MYKYLFFIVIFFFLNSCSVDTKTGFWENNTMPKKDKVIAKILFDNYLSYEDFKNNAIEYGEKSKFPKLENEK